MEAIPDRVLTAVSFAARRHAGQVRKDGVTPYVAHPMRVLFILRHVFGVADPDALTAAVLHDVIEDTTADRDAVNERFGAAAASYVSLLTKDKRLLEDEREDAYFQQLAEAPALVKLCKLADTLDNLIDVIGLKDAAKHKAAAKARRLLEVFTPSLSPAHDEALARVRTQIEVVERST